MGLFKQADGHAPELLHDGDMSGHAAKSGSAYDGPSMLKSWNLSTPSTLARGGHAGKKAIPVLRRSFPVCAQKFPVLNCVLRCRFSRTFQGL
ncbi:hypothetical protein [Terricaulis silvestris]|uniref:hypothetical protein n=1 Tax=Terricaulis silvestris TaxID=2686094 RepID=UPI00131A8E91|nr:hypothetical protein [Terricaulis silvestris]